MKTLTANLGYLLLILVTSCQLEEPAVPTAKAVPSTVSCTVPCEVKFTDASENTGIYIWNHRWDFGDETSSNDKNPTHTYIKAGQFKVVYTLSGKYGNTIDSTVSIRVVNDGPMASFSVIGGNCATPCEISFVNSSKNATSYLWNFGDKSSDSTSTATNPKHTYTKAGKFFITLTASKGGKNSVSRDTVTIKSAIVLVADFKFTQDTTKADSTVVTFTNLSSANATSYDWDFGNGKTSKQKNPVNAYKKEAGKDTIYMVKLQASANGFASQKEVPLTIKKK